MTQWNAPHDPGMMTPPVEGGPIEQEPTKWPNVIGIIGIIWASLGMFCSCVGFFAVPMQRWGVDMQSQAGQDTTVPEAQLRVAEQFQIVTIALIAIGVIFVLTLLFGSIGLVRRRRSARKLMMTWAIGSLLVLALNIAMQVMMYQATVAELNRAGQGGQAAQVWMSVILGGLFTVIFGLGPPLFVLIWFSRQRIKNEVERWP